MHCARTLTAAVIRFLVLDPDMPDTVREWRKEPDDQRREYGFAATLFRCSTAGTTGSMLSPAPLLSKKGTTMKTILALAVMAGLLALGCGDSTTAKKTEPVKQNPTPPKQQEESTHDRD